VEVEGRGRDRVKGEGRDSGGEGNGKRGGREREEGRAGAFRQIKIYDYTLVMFYDYG